ncbi:FOG: TPR repeat [Plasmopara halstedii]|uniref:FOG: TPR repeat n=1 Tax=Plasmopara halstedii TaxID=4781 RepID=A0A0P1AW20_PLAHL|nr:FOG: TPR repeat [Plasmopara halstedii]CEG46422.1 FOG: TPR repeat [Plasmopara halstedii]|eukprot:XP_024582791.1 FOG: TPR repeat [Plasmopara halstedii]
MTIATAIEPDFFALHNRKPKTIDVEMLDYGFVERCTNLDELKGILVTLRSGKEGRYPELEKATENRILAVLPERERKKIISMRSRLSANEVTTEVDELASWAAAMDLRNEALIRQAPLKREHPPVRGQKALQSELVRDQAEKINHKRAEEKSLKAISAYDFRSWEKYDADKALEDIDAETDRARQQARQQQAEQDMRLVARKQELQSLSKSVELDKLEPETRKLYAGYEKQKGNDCFKANEVETALLHYTRSIAYDDTDAIIYANRALVHLRLKNFAAAEDDATRAILLNPAYLKGWSRRGMTRYRRGKYAESIQDFEEALRLDPENREVAKLLKAAQVKHVDVNGVCESNQNLFTGNDANEKPSQRFEIIKEEEEENELYHERSNQSVSILQPEQSSSSNKPFTRFEIIEEGSEDEDDD